jgi:hypothetical protein
VGGCFRGSLDLNEGEEEPMELMTLVFEQGGEQNTKATLQVARERALALGIKQVVVASSFGYTAREAQATFAPVGIRVIVVSIAHGWESKGWTMPAETKAELQEMGVIVHTGVHALGGSVGSAFSAQHGGRTPEEIVRDTLYRFSQGTKVAVECLLMAADAGLLDMDQEVIAIGGTGDGADTALVCKPAFPRTFHDLEIREVLAKPRIP